MFLKWFIIVVILDVLPGCVFSIKITNFDRSGSSIPCDNGEYHFRQKCYRVIGQKVSDRLIFSEAERRCKSLGGNLVSIHSKEEQEFLSFLLLELRREPFIGLSDARNETHFKWTDGSPVDYLNWRPGEPHKQTYENEDCAVLVFRPDTNRDFVGEWNDIPCSWRMPFICQSSINESKSSPNPLYCPGGSGGWKLHDSCYHLVTQNKSWQDAEQHCKMAFGGEHLVKILDRDVEMFIDYMLSGLVNEAWIGIKSENQSTQLWSSGWHVSFNRMEHESFTDGKCAMKKQGNLWNMAFCNEEHPFICEATKEIPPFVKPGVEGSHCPEEPEGWRDLGGEFCYYFETEQAVTWHEANTDCIRRGGHLLSLHSKEESEILNPYLKHTRFTIFLGLVRLLPPKENVFVWSDGSVMDFTNWDKPNQPDFRDGIEKCGELYTDHMQWNDVDCNSKTGYICSVMKVIPTTTTITSVTRTTDFIIPPLSNKTTEKSIGKQEDCPGHSNHKKAVIILSLLLVLILCGIAIYIVRKSGYYSSYSFRRFFSHKSDPTNSMSEKRIVDHEEL